MYRDYDDEPDPSEIAAERAALGMDPGRLARGYAAGTEAELARLEAIQAAAEEREERAARRRR